MKWWTPGSGSAQDSSAKCILAAFLYLFVTIVHVVHLSSLELEPLANGHRSSPCESSRIIS